MKHIAETTLGHLCVLFAATAPTSLAAAQDIPPPVVQQSAAPPSPNAPSGMRWLRIPSGDDIEENFPDKARGRAPQVLVVMTCRIDAKGMLRDCAIAEERPAGFDFGAATLRLASKFRVSPQTPDGKSVEGGSVTIPVRWPQR